YSNPGACGTLLFGKELSKHASNCVGLLWSVINYVDAQRNYVCQRATNSFNSGLNIAQGLPGLFSQICSADDLPLRVPGSLARNVDCLAAIGDDDLRKTVLQTSEKRIRIYEFFRHRIQKLLALTLGSKRDKDKEFE